MKQIISFIILASLAIIGWFLPIQKPDAPPIYMPQIPSVTTPADIQDSPLPPISENIPTTGEENCLKDALNYLNLLGFSKYGLEKQLEFDGYSVLEIDYAIDNCGANWFEEAEQVALSYLSIIDMSRQALYDQLAYEGFTVDEIEHALEVAGYKAS